MVSRVSEKVQALYDKYPYPPREPCEALDPYVDYVRSFSRVRPGLRPTFLDAGCGTGSVVLGAALFQKHWAVYGCDFNEKSLQILNRDVEELGLTNVTTRQVDLLSLPDDFGPAEGFDVIFCTGVIHHTPDPLQVLKSLANRLAPQGVLRLMVYSAKGRADLYRFARAIQQVEAWQGAPLEARVEAARTLMTEMQSRGAIEGFAPPSLRGPFEGSHLVDSSEFADRYLHPHDSPYTLDLLRKHIEKAGLTFFRWFEDRSWDLDELLPSTSQRGDFPEEEWERYQIVEELFDRDQYDLYLVGPEFQPNNAPFTYDTRLRINPQVHLTETTFRGYPKSHQARLLFYPEEDLTLPQAKILKALSSRTASLGKLLDEWAEERSEDWLRAVLYLLHRDYLYRVS